VQAIEMLFSEKKLTGNETRERENKIFLQEHIHIEDHFHLL
jgi:hypothetical protein